MKPQKTKLTKPQEKLLREIAEHPGRISGNTQTAHCQTS